MILTNKEGDLNSVEISTLKTIRRKYTIIHVVSMLSLLIFYGFVMFYLFFLGVIFSTSKIVDGKFFIWNSFLTLFSKDYFRVWFLVFGAVGFLGTRNIKTYRLGKKWKAEVKPKE